MVYVLDRDGHPLMPTTRHGHVRRLLRNGKAIVVRTDVFTIRLTYDTKHYVQDVSLGVDCGSKHIGLSATTKDRELLSGVGELITDVVKLIAARLESRRTRRNRKTWHRQARFNNRVASKKPGWLPPSTLNRIDFHLKLIGRVMSILPVKHIILETGSFDPQLIDNPEIEGEEYQNGPQKNFYNTREYVLCRDNHTCQHCHGKSGDKILNVHHIETRQTGGNSPRNLITLCDTCHDAYHRGEFKLKVKRGTSLRDAAAMNVMKYRLFEKCQELYGSEHVSRTWGYITKAVRINSGLKKTHNVDARVISGNPMAKPAEMVYTFGQVRRHNRLLHAANPKKGVRKRKQSNHKVFGFGLYDMIKYNGRRAIITGRRTKGYFQLKYCDGNGSESSVKYTKLRFVRENRRLLVFNGLLSNKNEVSGIHHFNLK